MKSTGVSKRCAAPALPGTVSAGCGQSRGTSSVAGSCARTKAPATTASRAIIPGDPAVETR